MSFHEATVVSMSRPGDAIDLTLDDVLIEGTRAPASVAIRSVRGILRARSPVETISMEEDGEIVSFHEEGNHVLLIV